MKFDHPYTEFAPLSNLELSNIPENLFMFVRSRYTVEINFQYYFQRVSINDSFNFNLYNLDLLPEG